MENSLASPKPLLPNPKISKPCHTTYWVSSGTNAGWFTCKKHFFKLGQKRKENMNGMSSDSPSILQDLLEDPSSDCNDHNKESWLAFGRPQKLSQVFCKIFKGTRQPHSQGGLLARAEILSRFAPWAAKLDWSELSFKACKEYKVASLRSTGRVAPTFGSSSEPASESDSDVLRF